MASRFMLAVASIVLLFGSLSARADDRDAKQEEFVKRLFAGPVSAQKDKKTYACFVRWYDADHLARHPKQKVSAMKLLVTAENAPEDEKPSYSFRLGVQYRNRGGAFDSSGECRHLEPSADFKPETPMGCSVDCDGGGIGIDLTQDDRSAIIRLERIRVWHNNKPDEEASYSLDAGQDDHIFRLDRIDLKQCTSLVTDRQELAAMRRK